MAAPQKNAPSAKPSRTGGASLWARLVTPKGILATAVLIAAAIVYLFTVGPLGDQALPTATRSPAIGSPLASAPHLVCGDAGTETKTMSGSEPQTLDQIALEGRRNAGSPATRASLYQITLDAADEAAAKAALISWTDGASPDPLLQIAVQRSADGAGWVIGSVTTCG